MALCNLCLAFHHLKLSFHHLKLPLHHLANFELCGIGYYRLLQNGFILTIHTVFFGQLIFGKIITTVATRSQILRLKCTKFYFGWGSAPDSPQTPLGELTALPDP